MCDDDDCWDEPPPIRPLWWVRLVGLARRVGHRLICWRPSVRVRKGEYLELAEGQVYCRVTVDAGGELWAGSVGRICTLSISGRATVGGGVRSPTWCPRQG